jgi:response regulator RpfG family c-di-GMP phosphodiesterase
MTSDRPYRKALSLEMAVAELHDNSGTQFDPAIVDIFSSIIQDGFFFNTRFTTFPTQPDSAAGHA